MHQISPRMSETPRQAPPKVNVTQFKGRELSIEELTYIGDFMHVSSHQLVIGICEEKNGGHRYFSFLNGDPDFIADAVSNEMKLCPDLQTVVGESALEWEMSQCKTKLIKLIWNNLADHGNSSKRGNLITSKRFAFRLIWAGIKMFFGFKAA